MKKGQGAPIINNGLIGVNGSRCTYGNPRNLQSDRLNETIKQDQTVWQIVR